MCEHKNFKADVRVGRLENDVTGVVESYTTDIQVQCADCFKPFEFIGVPGGVNPNFPTVSADGLELRAPIKPTI